MIQLKKTQVINPATKQTGYTLRQVNVNTVRDKEIAQLVEQQGALTKGDAKSALSTIPTIIAQALAGNGKCILEDFGTFTLSTTVGMSENPEDVKKSDVKFGINFTPSDDLLAIIQAAEVKVVKTATTTDDTDTDDTTTDTTDSDGNIINPDREA